MMALFHVGVLVTNVTGPVRIIGLCMYSLFTIYCSSLYLLLYLNVKILNVYIYAR